jgi:hypothetical protein
MSLTHTHIAADLNESANNRYALTLQIAELGKRTLDQNRERRKADPFAIETHYDDEKPIYQALVMKSSEMGLGDELIG